MASVENPPEAAYEGEMADADGMVAETAGDAREGVTEQNVRDILAYGSCGVVALFALIYLVYFGF